MLKVMPFVCVLLLSLGGLSDDARQKAKHASKAPQPKSLAEQIAEIDKEHKNLKKKFETSR
jgi:hypothetical protein